MSNYPVRRFRQSNRHSTHLYTDSVESQPDNLHIWTQNTEAPEQTVYTTDNYTAKHTEHLDQLFKQTNRSLNTSKERRSIQISGLDRQRAVKTPRQIII